VAGARVADAEVQVRGRGRAIARRSDGSDAVAGRDLVTGSDIQRRQVEV
jgi:hypothetical protein